MNKEVLKKVSKCKTVEEVLKLAKANNKNITREEAEKAFEAAHKHTQGELSDEEISNVSGGSNCHPNAHEMEFWDREEDVQFIYKVGDIVQKFKANAGSTTDACVVVHCGVGHYDQLNTNPYVDYYIVRNLKCETYEYQLYREDIEK